MFICKVGNHCSKPGDKCNKIVVETREKRYYGTVVEDDHEVEIEIAKGWEIVKEINACDRCVQLWNEMVDSGVATEFVKTLK